VGFSFVCLRLWTDACGGEGGINFARLWTVTFFGLGDLLFKPFPKITFLLTFALVVLLGVLLLAVLLLLLHGIFLSDGIAVQNDDRLQPPQKQTVGKRCVKEADSPSWMASSAFVSLVIVLLQREKSKEHLPRGNDPHHVFPL
jgi:hypothetical protein